MPRGPAVVALGVSSAASGCWAPEPAWVCAVGTRCRGAGLAFAELPQGPSFLFSVKCSWTGEWKVTWTFVCCPFYITVTRLVP